MIALFAAFATAVGYTISALLEDRVAKQPASAAGSRSAVHTAAQPMYLVGMAVSVLAWALSLVALRTLPVFAVQAIGGSNVGLFVLVGWCFGKRRPDRSVLGLLVLLMFGLIALAVSAAPGDARSMTWRFPAGMWIAVVVIACAAWAFRNLEGRRGSAVLGIVSGLADGAIALCGRSMDLSAHHGIGILSDPLVLAIVPLATIGAIAFAGALQRGPAGPALACQHAVMTIVPAMVGLAVLGDRARAGWTAITVAGFVATVAAVLLLTLDPERSSTAETTTTPRDVASTPPIQRLRGALR